METNLTNISKGTGQNSTAHGGSDNDPLWVAGPIADLVRTVEASSARLLEERVAASGNPSIITPPVTPNDDLRSLLGLENLDRRINIIDRSGNTVIIRQTSLDKYHVDLNQKLYEYETALKEKAGLETIGDILFSISKSILNQDIRSNVTFLEHLFENDEPKIQTLFMCNVPLHLAIDNAKTAKNGYMFNSILNWLRQALEKGAISTNIQLQCIKLYLSITRARYYLPCFHENKDEHFELLFGLLEANNTEDNTLTNCIGRALDFFRYLFEETKMPGDFLPECALKLVKKYPLSFYNTGNENKILSLLAEIPTNHENKDTIVELLFKQKINNLSLLELALCKKCPLVFAQLQVIVLVTGIIFDSKDIENYDLCRKNFLEYIETAPQVKKSQFIHLFFSILFMAGDKTKNFIDDAFFNEFDYTHRLSLVIYDLLTKNINPDELKVALDPLFSGFKKQKDYTILHQLVVHLVNGDTPAEIIISVLGLIQDQGVALQDIKDKQKNQTLLQILQTRKQQFLVEYVQEIMQAERIAANKAMLAQMQAASTPPKRSAPIPRGRPQTTSKQEKQDLSNFHPAPAAPPKAPKKGKKGGKKEEPISSKKKKRKGNTQKKNRGGLFSRAKAKIATVASVLNNPQQFVSQGAQRLMATMASSNIHRMEAAAKRYDIATEKRGILEYKNASALFEEAMSLGLLQGNLFNTLEFVQELELAQKGCKIDRMAILEAMASILPNSRIEKGDGSHLNIHYTGGGLTIPRNKDGSDNAAIEYVKQALAKITEYLNRIIAEHYQKEALFAEQELLEEYAQMEPSDDESDQEETSSSS